MPRAPHKWTVQEDRILLQGVSRQGASRPTLYRLIDKLTSANATTEGKTGKPVDWNMIAQSFSNRTNKDCRKRWLKIDLRWNCGIWEAEEDNLLQKAVERHGKKYELSMDSDVKLTI